MSFLSMLTEADVHDAKTFSAYCQQRLGTPHIKTTDAPILQRQINLLLKQYPNASYFSLCRMIDWAAARRKKFATPMGLLSAHRDAWRNGFLPEFDTNYQPPVQVNVHDALRQETNPYWIQRLQNCMGEAAQMVFQEWQETRGTAALRAQDDKSIMQYQSRFTVR